MQKQSQNSGAGSRQQEQANAGGSMNPEQEQPQQEQQGGTYRPEGDRAVDFQPDDGNDITMETGQPEQTGGSHGQPDPGRREQQPQQSDAAQRRQAEMQDGDGEGQQGDSGPPGYGDR
ncbi:hypothetical protein [Tsuneonella sp. HG222]